MSLTPESDGKYLSSAGLMTLVTYESETDERVSHQGEPRAGGRSAAT